MSFSSRNSSSKEDDVLQDVTNQFSNSMSIGTVDRDTYTRRAKEAFKQGNPAKALAILQEAHGHFPDDKIKERIQKLKSFLSQMDAEASDEEDDEFIEVNDSGFMLNKTIYENLYDHQKEGVAFLYGLHRDGKKGGVLADDMGLGKTIQVISFLCGMYDSDLMQHCLLVMPTTLITNWQREFEKWVPGMRVREYHGTSKVVRAKSLRKIQLKGGVLITSYQMVMNNWELLSSVDGQEFYWDYVILDEAHKIKTSSTKTAKSVHAVRAKHRVLLTGTPVQNNLREMWSLFDFACQGSLLGTYKTFKTQYENPITRAREKDATPGEKVLGLKMSENLMSIIDPFFLRRTKAEVQKDDKDEKNDLEDQSSPTSSGGGGGLEVPSLPDKNDLVVWTYLSPVQEEIYRMFISMDHIKEVLMTTRSPLAELTILKKLCDHPRLLSDKAARELGLSGPNSALQESENENATSASTIDGIPDETLIKESGKLGFLIELLERLREEGNRTLVFSRSVKILNIIQRILKNRGFKMVRIDGTVTDLAEREKRIGRFQKDSSIAVFLLTTQVGGVGLTLTSANRVVIFDPSWNPATDAQAVDRAYRIGQTQNVIVYRLITCGTVEEKIYRRQVFKDSLIRQTTGDNKNPFRYFSKQELKELFSLEDTRSSTTQLQLQDLHSKQQSTDPDLMRHIQYLYTRNMFGISHHDLLFKVHSADEDDVQDEEEQYIEKRVQTAENLMKVESEIQGDLKKFEQENTEPRSLMQPPVRAQGRQGSFKREEDLELSPTYHSPDEEEPIVLDEVESPNSNTSLRSANTSAKNDDVFVLDSSRTDEVEALQPYSRTGEENNVISLEDDADMSTEEVDDSVFKQEENYSGAKVNSFANAIEVEEEEEGVEMSERAKDTSLRGQSSIVLDDDEVEDEENKKSPRANIRKSPGEKDTSLQGQFNIVLDDDEDEDEEDVEGHQKPAGTKDTPLDVQFSIVLDEEDDEGDQRSPEAKGSIVLDEEDEDDKQPSRALQQDTSLQGRSSFTADHAISTVDHAISTVDHAISTVDDDDNDDEAEDVEASREHTKDQLMDEGDLLFKRKRKTFVIQSDEEDDENDDNDESDVTAEETGNAPMESSRLSMNEGLAGMKEEPLDEEEEEEEEEEEGLSTRKKQGFVVISSSEDEGDDEEVVKPRRGLRLDLTNDVDDSEADMLEDTRDQHQSIQEEDMSTTEEKSAFLTYSTDEEEEEEEDAKSKVAGKHASKMSASTPSSQGSSRRGDGTSASGNDDISMSTENTDQLAGDREDSIVVAKKKKKAFVSYSSEEGEEEEDGEEEEEEEEDGERGSFHLSTTSLLSMSGVADRSTSSVASRHSLLNNLMEKFEDILMDEDEYSDEMVESDQENMFHGLDESG
ncbi:DNA excision repair protein ERCC-6-like [Engraulis encrasicolus]|uniref:DNA excision repair protein ERCC-6-like n=1 Tax=Engraulis encrasicolus TaxID=184585 RepID=UPI002FCFC812